MAMNFEATAILLTARVNSRLLAMNFNQKNAACPSDFSIRANSIIEYIIAFSLMGRGC